MTIIKNKLTQMILVGLLFAFILGVLSYVVRNGLSHKSSYEKQIVIIDVYYKNKISEYLNKINQINFLNKNMAFSQELFKSINYIKLRYKSDKKLSAGCYNLSMNLTDESIFIETKSYLSQNKKLMDECLSNLFDLSYKRLKAKLDVYNYREISFLNYELSKDSDLDNKDSDLDNKDNEYDEFIKKLCSDLDKVVKGNYLDSEDNIKLDKESENIGVNFLSLFNLHQAFIAVNTFQQICDSSLNYTTNKKKEFLLHLNALKDLIADTKFEEIYKVEKINEVITSKTNQYLSTKNIVLTFSLFGFIFGVLLVYNFGFLKEKNE